MAIKLSEVLHRSGVAMVNGTLGPLTATEAQGFMLWGNLGGYFTNGFLQANDTMQDTDALLHVISLVDWPKHVKSFFSFFFF